MTVNLVLLGNPGSGKGTHAALLAEELNIPHISTGDIFREHMSNRTPLGLLILEGMNARNYTPDDLTNQVVMERLTEPDCRNGFILDGYPRTASQVEFFRQFYPDETLKIVLLDVPASECEARLLVRGLTSGRADDQDVNIIHHRLQVYQETVIPVINLYQKNLIIISLK